MKRLHLIVVAVISLTWGLSSRAATDAIHHIINQLAAYPQEKTYVHTDATDYLPGERIWLKVYVVEALSHKPTDESLYAYVELVTPEGDLVSQVRIICHDGIYAGYLDIPQTAKPGEYYLRSYTDMSANQIAYSDIKPLYLGGKAPSAGQATKADHPMSDVHSGVLSWQRAGDTLSISSHASGQNILLAHCRAYPFCIDTIGEDSHVALHRDSIPQGVIELLLLDPQLNVLSRQLLMSDRGQEQLHLTVTSDKERYAPLDQAILTLAVPDLVEGESVDISVCVRGTMTHRSRPSSIVAHLLLGTDLQGGIDFPENYMGNEEKADSLLADRQWTRYDMVQVIKGIYSSPEYSRETTGTLSGTVRQGFRNKLANEAQISVIAPQVGWFAMTTTDSLGRFTMQGADFPEGTQYVLRAVTAKGSEHAEITVDERERPPFIEPMRVPMAVPARETTGDDVVIGHSEMVPRSIMLGDVLVTALKPKTPEDGSIFSQMADVSFDLKRIEEINATCLHELLRRIPGIDVRHNKCYIRTKTSIYGDTPAAIAIDGSIIDGEFDLDNIQMMDVARIDVFKSGSVIIWGSNGGNGVISVTTKAGNLYDKHYEALNQKKITPLGYQKPMKFVDRFDDRKTIYWNENVTDDEITFTLPDTPGRCHVVIEGVTSEGRLIHEEKDIVIEQ